LVIKAKASLKSLNSKERYSWLFFSCHIK